MSMHTHSGPSPTALRTAMRAAILTVVLALVPNGMSAMAQTSDCMEAGPGNSIARMVRHEADCRIALPHSIVPLPRDMVTIVWPTGP